MSIITKPMLASACNDVTTLDFENKTYLATPKLDGIRALQINGKLVSRTFKPIRNNYIREILENILPNGADGEIVCPGAFQKTSSGVMGSKGEPEFIFYWFDYVKDDLERPYEHRIIDLLNAECDIGLACEPGSEFIRRLIPIILQDLEHLKQYEQECLGKGFEGVCIRTSDSPYKCGRATAKQEWLLKLKQFSDDEAEILGFGEKMHNNNPAEKDNFGRTKRSTAAEGLEPAGTLGYLSVKDIKTGIKFEIGTGFSEELRREIWDNRKNWLNLIIKYKHFQVSGVKDKPRFPVYLGIRDKEDM